MSRGGKNAPQDKSLSFPFEEFLDCQTRFQQTIQRPSVELNKSFRLPASQSQAWSQENSQTQSSNLLYPDSKDSQTFSPMMFQRTRSDLKLDGESPYFNYTASPLLFTPVEPAQDNTKKVQASTLLQSLSQPSKSFDGQKVCNK